jgi:hypothetical protein
MAKWEMNCKDKDMVNNPPHYNKYGVECIEAIQSATGEGYEYYLQGNIIKYLWRYRYKNGVQDLEKAQWYLSRLIEIKKKTDSDQVDLLEGLTDYSDGC